MGSEACVNLTGIKSFSLDQVYLEDPYFINALEKEVAYLVSFDTNRLLAGFRETAGTDMRGANRYEGWENMLIGGHTMGHYMSACMHAYESANVSLENKDKLYQILKELLDGMDECQKFLKSGFLFGATIVDKDNVEKQFDNVEQGKANIITEAWVPWYTMHKILEGLVSVMEMPETLRSDARRVELREEALIIGTRLGNWVYDRVSKWSDETRKTVLSIEYGGMNDVMYDLYLQTGMKTHQTAAHIFDQVSLFEEVLYGKAGENVLNNRHANTTIPKFMGALKRYVVTGEEIYLEYAKEFWKTVSENHSYITGGNSEWEHFGEDNVLDEERTNCNCETCNAYNMLKMTKLLFSITGDVRYADWYENTFLNSIMSSQNPKTGMTTYFQPMASGYFKVYGEPYNRFWCCTGSGMENFTKLGESFYYAKDDMLIVNQYISSSLEWRAQNVVITQKTDIPKSDVSLIRIENYFEGAIALRLPEWLAEKETILLNGNPIQYSIVGGEINSAGVRCGYAVVQGIFHSGDEIAITLPMEVRGFALPDGENTYAFKYGPVVLSALLGDKDMEKTITGVDVLVPQKRVFEKEIVPSESEVVTVLKESVAEFVHNINEHMERYDVGCDSEKEGPKEIAFRLVGTDSNLTYVVHYKQHTERYGLYFKFVDADTKDEAEDAKRQKKILLERYCLDTVQPGYGQYENDQLHQMIEYGSGSIGSTSQGTRRCAKASGGFSYRMRVDTNRTSLLVSFATSDNGKPIKILAEDEVIYEHILNETEQKEFYDVIIPLDRELLLKKSKDGIMRFSFEGIEGLESANICNFMYTLAYMP